MIRRFCFVYDWRVMYSINVIVLVGLVAMVAFLFFDSRPIAMPEQVVSRELLNTRIRANHGEDLRVRVTVKRTADCPTAVHRWLINDDGIVLGNSITPSLFTGHLGNALTGIVEVPIANDLPRGHYRLHSDIIIDCGRRGTFTSTYQDLDFEVIP